MILTKNPVRLNWIFLYAVPPFLTIEFKKVNHKDTYRDAAHFIVDIQNAIVHSNQKRERIFELPFELMTSALHLSLWYIEMALLRILNHNGSIMIGILSKVRSHGSDHDRLVPWVFQLQKESDM